MLGFICFIVTGLRNLYFVFFPAEPWRKSSRLGKLMTGDDGIIYSCSDKFLYAFKSNGSMASNVHLNYTCNGSIAPVYAGTGKVNNFNFFKQIRDHEFVII